MQQRKTNVHECFNQLDYFDEKNNKIQFCLTYPGGVCCGHQVPGSGRRTAHGVVPGSGCGIGGLGASHDIKRLGDGYQEAITKIELTIYFHEFS